jgi:hypothetical protein
MGTLINLLLLYNEKSLFGQMVIKDHNYEAKEMFLVWKRIMINLYEWKLA